MEKIEDILICPLCMGSLKNNGSYIVCLDCNMKFEIVNDIPIMISIPKNDNDIRDGDDTNKNYVINYYRNLSIDLDSRYGRFIKFMNCGYVEDKCETVVSEKFKTEKIEQNSIRLLFEVIGSVDCSGKRIIEIGCGRGGNIYYLNKYFSPKEIIGMDLCLQNIVSCQNSNHGSFLVADAEKIPFKDKCFDVAVNIESSFHYSNLLQFFRDTYRILKSGGYLLYADVIDKKKVNKIEEYIEMAGFSVIKRRNITPNVLLSFESIANYTGANQKTKLEFSDMKNSGNYKKMKKDEAEYRIYTLKK